MNLDQVLRTAVKQSITSLYGESPDTLQVQPTNQEFDGSHTIVCFPLTKLSRKGPEETARQIGDNLVKTSGFVERFNVVKGFLNLVLTDRL